MDGEGDMWPISGLAQGGRECGGFILQIEERRGVALVDPQSHGKRHRELPFSRQWRALRP